MTLNISNDILEARNALYNQDNGSNLKDYMNKNNYGDQTPVATNYIKENKDKKIIITDEIQEQLDVINEVSTKDGVEIPYFLTGTKLEDGTTRFDNIIISKGNLQEQAASFNKESVEKLNKYVDLNKNNPDAIVCHGHTHPKHGDFYNQFSIDDLGAYVNFKNNPEFGKIDTIGMVLVDGNYNFVDYNGKEFEKIPNVFHEIKENEKYKTLPTYSHERSIQRESEKELDIQDSKSVEQNEYVNKFSNGWDETFNKIVEKSGKDKKYIKQEMIYQADSLNNTVYRLQCEGKISQEQADQICNKFNSSFNQAFKDFELPELTEKELDETVKSMRYTKDKVERGKTIADIDKELEKFTNDYLKSQKEVSLVEYKKETIFSKISNKIKELYNKIKANKKEEKQNNIGINEYGEIVRDNDKKNNFLDGLKHQINNEIPQFTPPNNNKPKDISLDDFTRR